MEIPTFHPHSNAFPALCKMSHFGLTQPLTEQTTFSFTTLGSLITTRENVSDFFHSSVPFSLSLENDNENRTKGQCEGARRVLFKESGLRLFHALKCLKGPTEINAKGIGERAFKTCSLSPLNVAECQFTFSPLWPTFSLDLNTHFSAGTNWIWTPHRSDTNCGTLVHFPPGRINCVNCLCNAHTPMHVKVKCPQYHMPAIKKGQQT